MSALMQTAHGFAWIVIGLAIILVAIKIDKLDKKIKDK